ncbi:MAG: cyanoexosortase A system-associated protein [Pseudanabaena sp. ELA645]|jgi:cyanosortase A-associated protein
MLSKSLGYKKLKIAKIQSSKKYFLIIAFTSSIISIGISLFIPRYQDRPKFKLPDQVSLSEWRSLSSEDLSPLLQSPQNTEVSDARRYFYTSSAQDTLRIDALYINGSAVIPKSLEILNLRYSIDSLNIRHQKTIGHYALFNDQDRVYLSSCINPRGLSTVTQEQLTNNRNYYDFTPDRIATYLLGVTYIRDNRCLFTIMSVPLEKAQISNLNNNSLDNAYQKLEKAWTNWYQKWENNFPNR